ncbi:unnamed protein product [Urochloa humidicola]
MATVPPPSPRPPKAHRDGGDSPVSLFVHTDLDTRLGLFVAPDTTMRALKLLVGAEHTAIFPDLGPVAVKSFQVRRLGALYHLSDSMTVTSACTKIKGAYFLHVKMTEASAATRCCQDEGRRLSAGQIGNYVEKHVPELPAKTSEIACDVLPRMLEGGDAAAELNDVQAHDALPSLTQLNTEMKKNEAVGLASDTEAGSDPVIEKAQSYSSQIKQANQTEGAYISSTSMENAGKPSNQSDTSHDVEKVHARKEDILHDDEDRDVGGGVSDNIEVRIQEQMLEEIHAMDNFTQEKEHQKSRTDSFEMSAPDPPRIANESDVGDLTKSSGAPLEAGTTSQREPLNTSFRQEVQDTLHQDTTEDTCTVAKKKKKKHELAPSKAAGQETSEPSAGAKELSKSTGDVCNVELTGRDDIAVKSSGLTLPSSGFDDVNHGGKLVQVMSDAQASSNLISEQGKFDRALKGCRNPSIGDAINSAGEVVASEGGNPKGSISRNGGEKHEQVKQSGEGSHDEGVAEISNMEKDGKSTDASEKRQTNDDASQLKRRKKAKKASSVDLASVDTTHEKEMHGYREHATGTDTVYTEREIVHGPSMHHSTDNVHQGDSNVTENPNGDGKKKKRRRRHSEHSKGVDPNQDLIKSPESVTTENSMHFRGGAALDAKQAIPDGGIEGATVINNKELGENLAANNVIDEVLADLRSKDSSSKILDEDITGQTHQGSNKKALELPESTVDNVGVTAAALPPKYPAPVHSDAPANSPRLKKPKGNLRSEKSLVSPKNSADAAEPNYVSVVRLASDAINFIDHFGSSKMDDTSVSAEHKQNNEDETLREVKNKKKNKRKQATGSIEPNDVSESLLPTDKTSLIGHLGTSKAIVPFVVENMNSEDENGKNGKEKKRRRKTNMEMPIAEKESPNFENQGTDKTNMEDATLEKKLDKNGVDNQNKLLTDEDHAHLSKDVRKSTSKIKPPVKSKNESIKGRVASNPKPVRNLVKDFSTSPLVSSDSTEGMPQNANRYRVAIRKVPSKRYEQTSEKSKKENRKVGSGAIFNDANSEGSDDELDTKKDKSVMEASPDTSAASGDSGISSAADDESDPDDDGNMSLSQKSLRGGMDIGSILRGSNSYKKAKKRELELLDDDTQVPDSQPTDDHWDWTETDPHKKH